MPGVVQAGIHVKTVSIIMVFIFGFFAAHPIAFCYCKISCFGVHYHDVLSLACSDSLSYGIYDPGQTQEKNKDRRFILLPSQPVVLPRSDAGNDGVEPAPYFALKTVRPIKAGFH